MMTFDVIFDITNNEFIASFSDSISSFRSNFGEVHTATKIIGGEPYSGEYTFTPTQQTQTVSTAGKILDQNITINPIPNNYGLITYNGFGITVS